MANAFEISAMAINGLKARGIILPDYVNRNLPAVVQLFIALSSPLRSAIRAFLTSLLGQLKLGYATTATRIGQCDVVAQKINTTAAIIDTTLAPLDNLLSSMPVDSAVGMSPDLAALLKKIADLAPIKIPALIPIHSLSFDMFEGVNSYADLRKKQKDLLYQATQTTSVSFYAQTANKLIADQILEVEAYLYVLDTLDGSPRTIIVDTGDSVVFPEVVPRGTSYGYIQITNQSTSPSSIGGTYSLSGSPCFTFTDPSSGTFLLATSGSSLNINFKFTPTMTGSVSGTLSIVHDGDNTTSPISISLLGRGI